MKLDPRSVRFVTPFLPLGRSPRLTGRQNTLHLQETALVIEGEVLKIAMPIVDSIFQRALAGWTTITVPYSRIVGYRLLKRRVIFALAVFVAWFPTILTVIPTLIAHQRDRSGATLDQVIPVLMALFVSLTLTGLAWIFLPTLCRLTYRRADGRRVQITFRVRPRKVREEFANLLERNRAAAAKAARHAASARDDAVALPG